MEYKIQDAVIHYEIIGEGKPIIMIHGIYVDLGLMKGCMEPIFKGVSGYKRIYIDMPGMGSSKPGSWIHSDLDIVNAITETIQFIVKDQSFLLVGQSFGGHISRGILLKLWERIDGIFFLCPCIVPSYQHNPPRQILFKDEKFLSNLTEEEYSSFNNMSVIQNEMTYRRYKDEVLPGINKADNQFLDKLQKTASYIWASTWRIFEKPTLILTSRQDDVVGYKAAYDMLDGFPRGTFAIIDGAGHNLQIEQVNTFNMLTIEWLKRVEEYRRIF